MCSSRRHRQGSLIDSSYVDHDEIRCNGAGKLLQMLSQMLRIRSRNRDRARTCPHVMKPARYRAVGIKINNMHSLAKMCKRTRQTRASRRLADSAF